MSRRIGQTGPWLEHGRHGNKPELGLAEALAVGRGDMLDVVVSSTGERAAGHIALDLTVEASVIQSSAGDGNPDTEQSTDWAWSTSGASIRRASSGIAGVEFLICALGLRPWPVSLLNVEEKG